jgi:hypothetical protein
MSNKRYTTGRTPQRSINNQHKQSKARHELDHTIKHYKVIEHTHGFKTQTTQTLHQRKVNDRNSHRSHDHRHRKRSSKRHWHNNIPDIQHGTATQQGGHGQQDQSVNNKQTTKPDTIGVRNTHKTGDKDKETQHREGAETNLCQSPTNRKLQAGKGTLPASTANTQNSNNKPSSGTGKNTRNKVTSINHTRDNKHTNQNTSPQRRNNAGRTPNNTMVSESGLLEDIRRTGRGRKQQRILQQAGRNAEAQEHTPGH